MNRKKWMLLTLALSLSLTGCASAMEEGKDTSRSVNVLEIQKEKGSETLEYIGIVGSKEMVKYSFKTPGKIEKIFVEKGQKLKRVTHWQSWMNKN